MRRGKGIAGLVMAFALTLAMVVGVIPAEAASGSATLSIRKYDEDGVSTEEISSGTATISAEGVTIKENESDPNYVGVTINPEADSDLGVSAGNYYVMVNFYVEDVNIDGSPTTATFSFSYDGNSYTGTAKISGEYKALETVQGKYNYFTGYGTVAAASSTSDDTSSSTSSSTDTSSSASTDSTKSNETAANEQVAAAENGNAERIGVPASSNVKISSIEAMTDANALAALPALVKTVEDATGQGVLKVMNFEIKATGSGQIIINVGSEYNGKIAVVGHYVNGQFTTQQCKVASNGYIYPSFASFSPVTVIVTNQTSAISAIPTTEKEVTTPAPDTGENDIPTILALIVALSGIAVLCRKRNAR